MTVRTWLLTYANIGIVVWSFTTTAKFGSTRGCEAETSPTVPLPPNDPLAADVDELCHRPSVACVLLLSRFLFAIAGETIDWGACIGIVSIAWKIERYTLQKIDTDASMW